MPTGWSINLSTAKADGVFEVDLPVGPLYVGQYGPVAEIVFWSERVGCWIHGVASHFERDLPAGHVQVTLGDLWWLDSMVRAHGPAGLDEAVRDLMETMDPGAGE